MRTGMQKATDWYDDKYNKEKTMSIIRGVLPALVTPLDAKGRVKTELAENLIDFYVKQQADGLYMHGWTGEGEYLTKEQRKLWTEAVLKAACGKLPVFVHCGYNTDLDDSVELAEHAASHGAYAVSSVGISREASLQENVNYFRRISEAAPDTPFYIYWIDNGRTLTGGKAISPAEILKAMEVVPTFQGIKFTDSNFYILERFKKHAPEINILSGFDELACCALMMGADGNIGAMQAVTCYHHKKMYSFIERGDYVNARRMQCRANELSEAYARADIGNLPGIKLILEKVYGIPVGYCSQTGPFAGHTISEESAEYLLKVFRENIAVPDGLE